MEELGQNTKEKILPSGIKLTSITPEQMSQELKKAPAIKWPFFNELSKEKPEANSGASTCLMAYVIGQENGYSGHFTVVTPPDTKYGPRETEMEEYKAYVSFLDKIRNLCATDKSAKVVLLGQHQSNLGTQSESEFLGGIWDKNKKRVNEDLVGLGLNSTDIVDLRGPKIGSTAAVYDPNEKSLYYTKYPPRN